MNVEPLLRGRFGRSFHYQEETESTQALLGPDDSEGAVAAAGHQSAGRGRMGRRWEAPPGTALTFSVLLRPPAGSPIQQLSLVAGLAVAEAVEDALQLSAQIKWPNDVMVDRRKVAGILAEARDGIVVVGIGVNVNQTREQLPVETAASLRTLDGEERDLAPLLADVLARLETHYDAWTTGGLDAVFDGIGSRDFLRGRRVSIDGRAGVAGGLDREGRLLVDGVPVTSGEVELRT